MNLHMSMKFGWKLDTTNMSTFWPAACRPFCLSTAEVKFPRLCVEALNRFQQSVSIFGTPKANDSGNQYFGFCGSIFDLMMHIIVDPI
jgi:hypothetical protein